MNAPFRQDERIGRLATALGKDVLVLLRFQGADHMNDLFDYHVEALSTQADLDFDGLIGTHATVEIDTQAHGVRAFDGIVTAARWAGVGENGHRYTLTLRPWTWIAGLRRNQRIFHNKTVKEIVTEVLEAYGHLGDPAFKFDLAEDYPVLEYTVQYRESDLAFVTRLLERFGISYHFVHRPGGHTMLMTDQIEAHATVKGKEREYKPAVGAAQTGQEHFWEWHPTRRMTTGALRLTDYNFKEPTSKMVVNAIGDAAYAEGRINSFDYPGDYLDEAQGRSVIGLRTAQERGQDMRCEAIGDCTSLGAGMVMTLTGDHAGSGHQGDFLCLTARHSYTSDAYGTGAPQDAGAAEGFAYSGNYTLMPATAPLAPERKTQIPVVQGPQTAVVVGEGEIDCDAHGRILVRFHWDLDDAYSMRCRVSQNWASKGWGGMVIPRIGMEVVVEFLEGDPDKPLVTGCVYNGVNKPPYDLPAHKTKSVFRTDTHKGKGFNELTFEDENGEEKIYLHGQKDHEIHIENNRAKRVDRNQSESVGNNKSIEVGNNHQEIIGGNMTLMVGPNRFQSAVTSAFSAFTNKLGELTNKLGLPDLLNMGEGNLIIGVGKNKAETVMVSSTEVVGAGKAVTVGGGYQLVVGGIHNTSIGIGSLEEVGHNKSVVVGKIYEVVVGKSKLVMTEDGIIDISGVQITINGESLIRLKAPAMDMN